MAPAQVLTGVDPEMKVDSTTNVTSDKDLQNSSAIPDEKGLKCMSNYEDTTFDMEISLDQHINTADETVDTEVDIIECVNSDDLRLAQAEDPNATEYSSSFDDTISGTEDGSRLNDAEAESRFCGDSESVFDGFDSIFRTRKKKLTADWRKYIRPLMWRCKWLELRIKEFQSQALKYDKELAAYDQRKQFDSGQLALEGCCMRALPFSGQLRRNKVMKRRKRKRVEDTVDISSYMAHHSLFSYYENKRSNVDGVSLDDDCGNQVIAADQNANGNGGFGVDYEGPLLDFGDGADPLEQILWNIEVVQTRVHKLKTQLDKVTTSNAGRLSSAENLNLLLPSEVPSSSARSPTVSPAKGYNTEIGVLYNPPQHVSAREIGDLVMPESAVSSYGEANPFPDIIESTMEQLSAADFALDQPQIGDSCEDVADAVLIHNQANHEELHSFEKLKSQPVAKPCDLVKEQEKESRISPVSAPKLDIAQKTSVAQEKLTLKSCLAPESQVPKYKRKRGERKPGSGSWSRKSSGEPDH